MGVFKKKPDPISDHARALNERIAKLQSEIASLNSQVTTEQSQPRVRSTALPGAPDRKRADSELKEPIFEDVDHQRVTMPPPATTPAHYNELGVRKFDLIAWWRRLQGLWHSPSSSNPKLVNYLVAGSIHGLRPLRYEKRVARNRFLLSFAFLLIVLWGILFMWLKNR